MSVIVDRLRSNWARLDATSVADRPFRLLDHTETRALTEAWLRGDIGDWDVVETLDPEFDPFGLWGAA